MGTPIVPPCTTAGIALGSICIRFSYLIEFILIVEKKGFDCVLRLKLLSCGLVFCGSYMFERIDISKQNV